MAELAVPPTAAVPDRDDLATLSDDALRDAVTTWGGRVAAGEARLLAYVGELDRREAWAAWGVLSCAHWLSWRLGMGLKPAQQRVRVARALRDLPVTAAAFAAGELSYCQVRAITRVATADDETTFVELARCATGAQLERLARGLRRARRIAEDAADPLGAQHRMRTTVRYDDDGSLVLVVRAPAEQGAVLLAAFEAVRADLDERACAQAESADAGEAPDSAARIDGQNGRPAKPPRATLADGLVHLARHYLESKSEGKRRRRRVSRADLQVQLDPLSRWGRLADGEFLPPAVTERLLTAHDTGRRTRHPTPGLRALLGTLEGERCRFPGCTRRRRLHAHHVQHWEHGGRTDLANLLLLCSRHHTVVHRDGYQLSLHADRRLVVRTAEGQPLPHRPQLPRQPADDLGTAIGPDTLPPQVSDARLDLHYAVSVLMQQAA